ncbi:hypothetical protein MtrunA17_Chr1g0174061 [Medicago truncatula]|uniref:Transmembrane protein n=1 Tax=Medicago truncatula TaxID=3880 RepID=A0A396JP36_MEDTR|nr:hypothetical protein MtrunA17_Chr1g0174061 [Medicago truncatula]
MSGLHDDITILFSACGSSSPSPLFARFFRRGPWISSSPVAFLTWLDLFWLLLLTVVGLIRLLVVKREEVATMYKAGFAFSVLCWAQDCLFWCFVLVLGHGCSYSDD